MSELKGTSECQFCGLDQPHYHSATEQQSLRFLREDRRAFERWFMEARHSPESDVFLTHFCGFRRGLQRVDSLSGLGIDLWPYENPTTQGAWDIWQAAAQHTRRSDP